MFTRTLSALAAAGLTAITLAAATPLYAQSVDDCQAEVAASAKQELALARAGGPSYRLALRVR